MTMQKEERLDASAYAVVPSMIEPSLEKVSGVFVNTYLICCSGYIMSMSSVTKWHLSF
jgi:hypothetical protein